MSKTIKEIKDKKKSDNDEMRYLRVKTAINILKTKDDGEKGIVEAYVSIFDNVDLGGDKIVKGAFKESLKKKLPKGVWMHNWDEPIAKTIEAKEDDKGLYIKGQLILDVQKAKEAYILMKEGVIDEFSIGYRILDWEVEEDGTWVLKKLKLYEWSPVLAGMNPDTELIGIKADKKIEKPKKVKYVDVSANKLRVKIYYSDGTVERIERKSLTHNFKKYLKSQGGVKVEPTPDTNLTTEKVLRIRQAARIIDKSSEFILRLSK